MDLKKIGKRVEDEAKTIERVLAELRRIIVGQEELLRALVMGLLADGHILLEGVPGLGKTLSVHALARSIEATFQRIQFTPDLMPSDVVGTLIYTPQGGFEVKKGPIFANLVLADEINRAPAKVQSALLEAMQERSVTIGETTHPLPRLFLVLATQNPIEQEGTYPLPEAQVDRFLLKVELGYPKKEEERKILDFATETVTRVPKVDKVLTPEKVLALRELCQDIYMDEKIKDYIVDLVCATRDPKGHGLDLEGIIEHGASPRATIGLAVASRVQALLEGRPYVTPQDVKTVAPLVLAHRLILSFEAEAEELTQRDVVRRVLSGVKVP